MAGKSTRMRAIGVSAILVRARAPARALPLSLRSACASLTIKDTLAGGKSRFLVEVERPRATI